jgi:hypothetical protein
MRWALPTATATHEVDGVLDALECPQCQLPPRFVQQGPGAGQAPEFVENVAARGRPEHQSRVRPTSAVSGSGPPHRAQVVGNNVLTVLTPVPSGKGPLEWTPPSRWVTDDSDHGECIGCVAVTFEY